MGRRIPPRNTKTELGFYSRSAFTDEQACREMMKKFPNLGNKIVILEIADSVPREEVPGDPGHFGFYMTAAEMFRCVVGYC